MDAKTKIKIGITIAVAAIVVCGLVSLSVFRHGPHRGRLALNITNIDIKNDYERLYVGVGIGESSGSGPWNKKSTYSYVYFNNVSSHDEVWVKVRDSKTWSLECAINFTISDLAQQGFLALFRNYKVQKCIITMMIDFVMQ